MKFSPNDKCPCGSNIKYKKCCQVFHKGKKAKNALELMKSRYVAYKLKLTNYIVATTHIDNKDYLADFNTWEKQILKFCQDCEFQELSILEFIDGDLESFVRFRVQLYCNNNDNSFTEKSKFLKIDDRWFYHSGEFDG